MENKTGYGYNVKINKTPKKKSSNPLKRKITKEEIEKAKDDYFKRGGRITKIGKKENDESKYDSFHPAAVSVSLVAQFKQLEGNSYFRFHESKLTSLLNPF